MPNVFNFLPYYLSCAIVVILIMFYNYSSGLDIIDEEGNTNDNDDEVFDKPADKTMEQFTKSIGALNAMCLGVQVLKAKVSSEQR